jgi:hypothetical protein
MYALCAASGEISFARSVPRDLSRLPIASGPGEKLRSAISGVARHAYDGEMLLVPGIPEAKDEDAALDALFKFKAWIRKGFESQGLTV